MKPFETFNHYAPALTLLVLIGGLIWTTATRNAEFDQVRTDLAELTKEMTAVREEIEQARETLPHLVSCIIDVHRQRPFVEMLASSNTLDPDQLQEVLRPASCDQALARTTPQGDQ